MDHRAGVAAGAGAGDSREGFPGTLLFLDNTRLSRRLSPAADLIYHLAIAPLGVGSGLPFSLTFGLALVVMARRLEAAEATGRPGAARRNRIRVIRGP